MDNEHIPKKLTEKEEKAVVRMLNQLEMGNIKYFLESRGRLGAASLRIAGGIAGGIAAALGSMGLILGKSLPGDPTTDAPPPKSDKSKT